MIKPLMLVGSVVVAAVVACGRRWSHIVSHFITQPRELKNAKLAMTWWLRVDRKTRVFFHIQLLLVELHVNTVADKHIAQWFPMVRVLSHHQCKYLVLSIDEFSNPIALDLL